MLLALGVDLCQGAEDGVGLSGRGFGGEADGRDRISPFGGPIIECVFGGSECGVASGRQGLGVSDGSGGGAELLGGCRGVGGELVGMVEQALE